MPETLGEMIDGSFFRNVTKDRKEEETQKPLTYKNPLDQDNSV